MRLVHAFPMLGKQSTLIGCLCARVPGAAASLVRPGSAVNESEAEGTRGGEGRREGEGREGGELGLVARNPLGLPGLGARRETRAFGNGG